MTSAWVLKPVIDKWVSEGIGFMCQHVLVSHAAVSGDLLLVASSLGDLARQIVDVVGALKLTGLELNLDKLLK